MNILRLALGCTILAISGAIPIHAAEQAGVSAGVRGDVRLTAATGIASAIGRQVRSGEEIFLGDHITSGTAAGMQIMLLDETTFTIGADSDMVIDTFVFDPRTGAGKVSASISKGVFRFVTGQVARNEPRNMEVKLPNATIGIRGTVVWGEANRDGTSFVALAGPGNQNNSGERRGGIVVSTASGSREVYRSGWGVMLVPGQPPQVQRVPEGLAERILGNLGRPIPLNTAPAPVALQGLSPTVSTTDLSGQSTAGALPALGDRESIAAFSDSNDADAIRTSQATATMTNGISTFEDLRSIASGQGYYQQNGLPIGADGTYNYLLEIDFASRVIGGATSNLQISGGTIFDVFGFANLGPQSFASGSGPAKFTFNNTTDFSGSVCGGTCTVDFVAAPQNVGGVVAHDLSHTIQVQDVNSVVIATGSGTTTRQDGAPGPPP